MRDTRGAETPPHVLREYALLADGERGALIGPRGDIGWLCAPRWHDDAVFCALIGGKGVFSITPRRRFVWGGSYEDGSLIWRSRWVTTDGIIECREALAFPGDPHRVVLMRRLRAVRGNTRATLTFAPAAEFGRTGMTNAARDDHGGWHADLGDMRVRLTGVPHATATGDDDGHLALQAELDVTEGEYHDVVAEFCTRRQYDPLDPEQLWSHTETAWRRAVPALDSSIAVRDARHSYAVLRGLTSKGGGMVAAATMSLPERADQGRNYDYRYVWIRDQCYAGQAAAVDEAHPLLDEAVCFVAQRLLDDGPNLRPAYRVDGRAVPGERSLDLPGYPGGEDIVGNHANDQFQLDALGEALLLFAAAARHDRLDRQAYRAATDAVAAIAARWQQPDAGIWELDDHEWTHSRLSCVAGLRAMSAFAAASDARAWSDLADVIMADAADKCVHASGRWQRAVDDPRVDAALLVPAIRGALPAQDPRSIATLDAVCAELADDCYVYRYRHDDHPLAESEGAFLLCGFWTALAHHQQGDPVSAARYFERNRAACGPPGLLCEEYDVVQRQLRGNLPQAFAHALLMETSLRLANPPSPTPARRRAGKEST